MSVKIRPINYGDVDLSYGEIKNLIGSGKNESRFRMNVESDEIFGDSYHVGEEDKRFEDPYTKMGHIKLALPVLNPFLAGEDGRVWQKVLGTEVESDIADVVRGNKFYSIKDGKSVHVSNMSGTYNEKDWLIGGQYLRKLIDELDVEKEIEDLIYDTYVYPTLKEQKGDGEEFTEKQLWRLFKKKVGEITKGDGEHWVIDDYYYTAPDGAPYDYSELDDIIADKVQDKLTSHMDRLVMLLALRGQKNKFKDQVQDIVFVLPKGYRPRIEGGPDPLTKQYNLLVKANNDLREVISYANIDIKTVQSRYKELYNRVVNVFMGCKSIRNTESYKPLTETLSHKTGLIRNNMLATRVDYSGRSVITSDPNMPLDCVGIPEAVCEKLCEIGLLKEKETKAGNKSYMMSHKYDARRHARAIELMEESDIVIGRQPTLHYLSMQGFTAVVVKGNAVVLSPLVVMPFNADFDGDQMWYSVPVTEEAKEEVRNLMKSTNNLFYPRNGDVTVVPRHEILYGLYIASTVTEGRNKKEHWTRARLGELADLMGKPSVLNMSILEAVFEGVCSQVVNVYDTVEVPNMPYNGKTAGIIAIKFAMGSAYASYCTGVVPLKRYNNGVDDKAVDTAWCKCLLQDMAEQKNKAYFVTTVNRLVKLGFSVAEIYPPTITLINSLNVKDLTEEFDESIKKQEELYNRGFETAESFSSFYAKQYSELERKAKERIDKELPEDSGWKRMVKSGAKGSKSNLLQLFGFKGRMMKDKGTAFNAIIKGSLSDGLSGLEHWVTSYGSRQGVVDKVVATDKPGYLSRKIKHTAESVYITEEDCGTDDGLLLTYWDVRQFIPAYQITNSELFNSDNAVKPYFCKILAGRYVQPGSVYIPNEKEAEQFYDAYVARNNNGELEVLDGIKVRSPITCDNPCCAACYGRDLATMSIEPAVGMPVGFIAAQAIGEPGTQLTMKKFQGGGVAGGGDLMSSFDIVNSYLHLYSLRKGSVDDPINYDFISPASGDIEEVYLGNGTKLVKVMAEGKDGKRKNMLRSKLVVFDTVELKKHVEQGESIRKVQGNLDIREIMKERNVEEAQKYLALVLYDTFKDEVDVNIKHFEVVVAGMTFLVCMAGNDYFKTGHFYTTREYRDHNNEDCIFFKTLKGIKEAPKYKNDFFSTILMEDMTESVRRSIVLNPADEMKDPIVRLAFGLSYGIGSDIGNYLTERGQL